MNIEINRNLAVPIYTQIVGQIQFGIVFGRLPFGAQLPSIRDLAQELNVAPMTITQAYQELKQLGLIEMRAGLGTFVAEFSVAVEKTAMPNGLLQMRRMLRRTVAEAREAGFPEGEIRQTFMSLLTDPNSLFTNRYLVLVGLFPTAAQSYANDLERGLAAEQVVVEPLSFDDLRARPAYYAADLGRAEALLVPLHQIHMLREALESSGLDSRQTILGLGFSLHPTARQAILDLPSDIRIGIVSRFPEFVNTMLQGISAVRPLAVEPFVCLSTDPACLIAMCGSVQAIIYATGSEEVINGLRGGLPHNFPLIEYLHTPDTNTYQRIRRLLTAQEPSV